MVVAAAADHGVALERAQPGRRLAGVGDAGAGVRDLGDVARRERRDARHALHEVQADALGGQHAPRRVRTTTASTSPGSNRSPSRDEQLDRDRGVGQPERRREDLAAAEDPGLARDEVGARGRGRPG